MTFRRPPHLEKQVDEGLVVAVLDVADPNPFASVLVLLPLEDVLIEVIVQLLIGCVDAHLLEAVALEVLEAGEVKDADGRVHRLAATRDGGFFHVFFNPTWY